MIILAGPTAAGKTALAIKLAEQLNGEIISADSRQIYQGLDIGTGKPGPEEMARIRHHLVSVVSPQKSVSAGDFSRMAEKAFQEITNRGKTCLLVGGTGLWIRAFIDGLTPALPADPEIRAMLTEKAVRHGKQALHQELKQADPATAARLHPSDQVRIIRALEIFILTGERPSERKRCIPISVSRPACWLGIVRPREELYARAEQRIDSWLAAGWREEIARLLKQGVPAEASAMQAIGYSHWVKHLSGACSYDQTVALIKRDSRRYIKRQLTWFRAEKRLTWIDVSKNEREVMREIKNNPKSFIEMLQPGNIQEI